MALLLMTAGWQHLGHANGKWPNTPSVLDITTDYGRLNVATSDYVYESQLLWDGLELDPTLRGILNITYIFKLPESVAALISVNNGSNSCPIHYRWVILKKADAIVSPEFGSCSERIEVSATPKKLTMRTPNPTTPDKIDVYIYDGKKITQRHGREP